MSAKQGTNGHAAANGHNRLAGVLPASGGAVLTGDNGAAAPGVDPGKGPQEGRDGSGKFAPGNRLGNGNPHYRRQAELRRAVLDVVTPDKVRDLFTALLARATAGDNEAAKLVLAYAVGKPTPAPNPDAADLNEWALAASAPDRVEILAAMMDGLDPAAAAELVRLLRSDDSAKAKERVFGKLPDVREEAEEWEVELLGEKDTILNLETRRQTQARRRRADP